MHKVDFESATSNPVRFVKMPLHFAHPLVSIAADSFIRLLTLVVTTRNCLIERLLKEYE